MKEKLRNKKVVYTIIGIVSVLLVALAVTYAYWLVTKTQTGENEITAGCLDITISGEKNDINLTNEFPMSDEDGMKLVPYEFTVTNNCNTSVDYQVALEATGAEETSIISSALKIALNDSYKLYSAYPSVETTIDGAYESRVIGYSKLAASGNEGSSDTYSLRIWIDAEAPISEMNKTFKSRISVTVGQGIESPYEEGTLAYDILANYNGVNAIRAIDATKYAHEIVSTGQSYISTSNNDYYGTEYSFDETTKRYTLSGTLTQAKTSECRSGTKTCGKYTLKSSSSTSSNKIIYEVIDWNNSKGTNYVTANSIMYVNELGKGTAANDAGLYKTQDDLGDSYYFRGMPINNFVEFGTYSANTYIYQRCEYDEDTDTTRCYDDYYNNNELCEQDGWYQCKSVVVSYANSPMYWRIVRINGDGTIRMIYDGPELVTNGTKHNVNISTTSYNSGSTMKYVGYTYDVDGVQTDSKIKGVIDAWYKKHLKDNYGEYIADEIFCNDRSISEEIYYNEDYEVVPKENAVYEEIEFSYYKRYLDFLPSLKCTNKSDRYTVDDTTNGNGLLSNPIGLLTADEVSFAGGTYAQASKIYYLYSSEQTWTMTPFSYSNNEADTISDIMTFENSLNSAATYESLDIGTRPVINLKADVEFTGNGTIDNPYKIVTE